MDFGRVLGPADRMVDSYFAAIAILQKSCSRRSEIAIFKVASFLKTTQNRSKIHFEKSLEADVPKC